jgi:hypothetical protein
MTVFFSIFIGIRIDLLSLRRGDIFRCVDNNRKNRLEISFCLWLDKVKCAGNGSHAREIEGGPVFGR